MLKIATRVQRCISGKLGERDVRIKYLFCQMNIQDCLPILLRRKIDEDTPGQSPHNGIIEIEGPVGGHHDEGSHVFHAVPFSEKLVDEITVAIAIVTTVAGAENSICFVNEDDTRFELAG